MKGTGISQQDYVETTGKKLLERARKEIEFLKGIIQNSAALGEMEKVGFILKGTDGIYRRVSKDVRTLLQERTDALETSRLKLEHLSDNTFIIESGKDIHTNLRDKKLQRELKKYAEQEVTQTLTGQQIYAKVEKELEFYRGIDAQNEKWDNPETNIKHHLIDEARSPKECAVANYRHFNEVQEELALKLNTNFAVPKGDIYRITGSQAFQQQIRQMKEKSLAKARTSTLSR
jgi:hypothetical protein